MDTEDPIAPLPEQPRASDDEPASRRVEGPVPRQRNPFRPARPAPLAPPKPAAHPLTIRELQRVLVERLGFTLAENTLQRWCSRGKIEAFRLGTAWRIPPGEVERIIDMAKNGLG